MRSTERTAPLHKGQEDGKTDAPLKKTGGNLKMVRGSTTTDESKKIRELNALAARAPFSILHKPKKHDPL
jgi:hypothetical protein